MAATATAIATALYKVVVTIPKIWNIFQEIQKLHLDKKIADLKEEHDDYISRRRALSNAIEVCKTKEDRRNLSIMLHELNREWVR